MSARSVSIRVLRWCRSVLQMSVSSRRSVIDRPRPGRFTRFRKSRHLQNPVLTWAGSVVIILTCVLSGLLVQAATSENGAIKGRVIDKQTKAPLQYANVVVVGTVNGAMCLEDGTFRIASVPIGTYEVKAMMMGYRAATKTVTVESGKTIEVEFALDTTVVCQTQTIVVTGERKTVNVTSPEVRQSITGTDGLPTRGGRTGSIQPQTMGVPDGGASSSTPPDPRRGVPTPSGFSPMRSGACLVVRRTPPPVSTPFYIRVQQEPWNTEDYDPVSDNGFLTSIDHPVSTFAIDVDAASYTNVRRFVRQNVMPPKDAVRIEELINYFTYDYPDPEGDIPFSITAEVAECPWNPDTKLVHLGLQGKRVATDDLPANNLVFLLDVSGSMKDLNKLPLLQQAFRLFVSNLRDEDRVAIVVYASQAAVILPPTPGSKKQRIIDVISGLHASGKTNGAGGLRLAYEVAEESFVENGNNRVILATDGDFNIGVSSDGALVRLIEEERETGVFLSILGFGTGNYKDNKLEKLADKGNGNYGYVDDLREAHRMLVGEMGATLFTIAKDVKIQIEFNPARVQSYRLIGYENRLLKREDFDDDTKDAGELGAGHSVTALYEIVPAPEETASTQGGTKYVTVSMTPEALKTRDLLTVYLRYKRPEADASELLTVQVEDRVKPFYRVSSDFQFAAAVAEFGMLLRGSPDLGLASYDQVLLNARPAIGNDPNGYRAEFVSLVDQVRLIELSFADPVER